MKPFRIVRSGQPRRISQSLAAPDTRITPIITRYGIELYSAISPVENFRAMTRYDGSHVT